VLRIKTSGTGCRATPMRSVAGRSTAPCWVTAFGPRSSSHAGSPPTASQVRRMPRWELARNLPADRLGSVRTTARGEQAANRRRTGGEHPATSRQQPTLNDTSVASGNVCPVRRLRHQTGVGHGQAVRAMSGGLTSRHATYGQGFAGDGRAS
jgi:hypothetical protein